MFEILLGVPRDLFDRGELFLISDWPRWLMTILFAVGASALVAMLWRQRRALAPLKLVSIGLLQWGMLAILLLILWQPGLRTEQLRAGDNVVAVMLDTSESMSVSDSDASRLDRAVALLDKHLIPTLEREYAVQRFLFADSAQSVVGFDALPTPGVETGIGNSLLQVLGQAGSTPLAAVVLLSDGADNSSGELPELFARVAGFGVPIHTIGFGREQMPEDLELADVAMPSRALPGTTVAARLAIRHDGAGTARIKVLDGDSILAASELDLSADASITTAFIDFPVPDPGHHDLVFSLERRAGESDARNNVRARTLEVPEDRYRLLYLEGEPRWEYKFLRRALQEDPSVELVSVLRVSPNKFYRQGIREADELSDGFPSGRAALFEFDAVIIGSIEAARFSADQQAMLRDFVGERGGSLLMLGGSSGLGAGGWGNSALAEVLPSRLADGPSIYRREQVQVGITPLGSRSPMLKLSEDAQQNQRLWRELPAVADYQTMGPLRPGAVSLLDVDVAGRPSPLLVMQSYGRGHSYILATGGTWRWQMSLPAEDQSHETFWRQLARGLVANSPERFELSADIDVDRVTLVAELRDQDYRPEKDMTVTAMVSGGSREAVAVQLRPADRPGVLEGTFSPGESGVFFVESLARREQETIGTARLSFRYDTPAEYFGTRQNRALLTALGAESGGGYWAADKLDGLVAAIRNSAAGITEINVRPLWDAPALFVLLLLLKSTEWLLRRRWRSI